VANQTGRTKEAERDQKIRKKGDGLLRSFVFLIPDWSLTKKENSGQY
jgi:hypothetical protein